MTRKFLRSTIRIVNRFICLRPQVLLRTAVFCFFSYSFNLTAENVDLLSDRVDPVLKLCVIIQLEYIDHLVGFSLELVIGNH